MKITITDDELFNELKKFLEPEFEVSKGIPIHVSERGKAYETRVMRIPEEMAISEENIIEVLKSMATCATRGKVGDLVSIRASELSWNENAYQIWLRICVEDKSCPITYRKVDGKYGKIETAE